MTIDKISHIGIIVKNLDKTIENYKKILGIEKIDVLPGKIKRDIYGNKIDPYSIRMGFIILNNIPIELEEIVEGDCLEGEFLKTRGEGIHHLTIDVPNIEEAIDEYKKAGIEVLRSGKVFGIKFAYLDTESTLGFVLELMEVKQRKKGT